MNGHESVKMVKCTLSKHLAKEVIDEMAWGRAESRKGSFVGLLENGRKKTCTVPNGKKAAERWNEPSQDRG